MDGKPSVVGFVTRLTPLVLLAALLTGVAYSAGQHSIIGQGYLYTFGYSDTLFQAFNVVRQLVTIMVVALTLLLIAILCLFLFLYLRLAIEIPLSLVNRRISDVLHEREYSKAINEISVLTISKATMANPDLAGLLHVQRRYVALRRWREGYRKWQRLDEKARELAHKFTRLDFSTSEPSKHEFTIRALIEWIKVARYSHRFLVPYTLGILVSLILICALYSLTSGTFYLSWFFASSVYLLIFVLVLLAKRAASPVVDPPFEDKVFYYSLGILSLALFMFLLGRDDVQANINRSSSSCVELQQPIEVCGQVLSANSTLFVIMETKTSHVRLIPWNNISQIVEK